MKSNRFSKYFVNKSDDELQAIVVSDKHVPKAKQAAYWELERRNLTPQTELPEETPSINRYKYRMSISEKKDFRRKMFVAGLFILGIAIYFNYDTLLINESDLKPIDGSVQYSRTYIERVTSRDRYGFEHESNRAALEIKLFERPRTFRIFENIEQKWQHQEFIDLTERLSRSTPVTIWVPDKPTRYGPDFFKLDVHKETVLDMDETTWTNRFGFMLLTCSSILFFYLGTRTDWAEKLKGFIKG